MERVASITTFPEEAKSEKQSVEAAFQSLNRIPLFMTELDETDGGNGENVALEAIKVLAHEGEPTQVAQNFKDQGDGFARARAWKDARSCYNQALGALRIQQSSSEGVLESSRGASILQDLKARAEIEEKCFANRALCNLELKNYGSCKNDCAEALRLNPRNLKAVYRYASAFMALDDLSHAEEACSYGQALDPSNLSFKTLSSKISRRKRVLFQQQRERQRRQDRKATEVRVLGIALKARNVVNRISSSAPDVEDAFLHLSDPLNFSSTLVFPILLMYPLAEITDFIKGCEEQSTLADQLQHILPTPWDHVGDYTLQSVDCLMETTKGSLIKVGKKLALIKVLSSNNVELIDNLAKIYIVPKAKLDFWIRRLKEREHAN